MTILSDYIARTPTSRALAERATTMMPDGVTTDTRIFDPYGIYVQRADGAWKWDMDGNAYLDYFGGHGALMLGHAHPKVTRAVMEAIPLGIQYAASSPREVDWASLIQDNIPCAERIRFAASGTEATLLAMRIARAFTGRQKIMRVSTHYHGWHDFAVSGYAANFDGSAAPGVLDEIAANTVLVRHDDESAMREALLGNKDQLAAVILEPLGSHFGLTPTSDSFIRAAAETARTAGVLVIMDEVVSGFRVAMSGYQGLVGLDADLTCMGKVAAGGMPGGLVCGREEIMSVLTRAGSAAHGLPSKVFHQGTFTGNPVTAASAIATIEELKATDGCTRATATATDIRQRLDTLFRREGTTWRCYGRHSVFHIIPDVPVIEGPCEALPSEVFARRPVEKLRMLRMALLTEGVDISSRGSGFVSAIHGASETDALEQAFERAIKRLKTEGFA